MLRNHDLIRQLIREVLAEERGPVSQTVVIGPVGSTFRPVAAPGLGKIIIASAFAKAYGWLGDYTGEGCIMANPNYPCTRSQPLFEAYSGAAAATGTTGTTPAPAGDFQSTTYTTALGGDKDDLIASYKAAGMAVTQWLIDPTKKDFSDLDTTPGSVREQVVVSVSTMLSKTCLVSTSLDNKKIDDMILRKLNKRADFKAFLLKFVDSAHSDFISITNGHSSKFKMDTKFSGSLPAQIQTIQKEETAEYNSAKAEIKKL
jgi:hypothetical protein